MGKKLFCCELFFFKSLGVLSSLGSKESSIFISFFTLFSDIATYSGLISKPIHLRSRKLDTAQVVPLPTNGPKTMSPLLLLAQIILFIKASGFCVGCFTLSGLE